MLILASGGAPPRRELRLDRVRTRSQDRSNVFDFEATDCMVDFMEDQFEPPAPEEEAVERQAT